MAIFKTDGMSALDDIFDKAHGKCKRKQATIERLDRLYNENIAVIKQKRVELEICSLLKIWLEKTWDDNRTQVKLYRVADRARDVISYFKNVRNIVLKPTEHNYIKRFVKSVQNELDNSLVATPASQAPILYFGDGLTLVKDMWEIGSKRAKETSKLAALVIKLSLYTGGRTGDFLRLKWDEISVSRAFNGDLVLSLFCRIKTDPMLERPGRKDIFCPKSDRENPFEWLKFIAEKRSENSDYVFTLKSGARLTTDLIVYHMARAAERTGLGYYPTGHSARNAMIATLKLAGLDDSCLKIAAGWKPDSSMPNHYLRSNLGLSKMGAAYRIRELINTGDVFKLQTQIINSTN